MHGSDPEKITKLMATLVFKLGLVPQFLNDPEPVPKQKEGESYSVWQENRFQIKIKKFNRLHATVNQMS